MDLREGFYELSWNLSEGKRGRKTSGKGMHAKSLQSYLTLCNPMDCSPPGSSVHRIFQARVLVWVAMPSSRGSSRPRDWTHVSYVSCIGRWVLYHSCATWEAPLGREWHEKARRLLESRYWKEGEGNLRVGWVDIGLQRMKLLVMQGLGCDQRNAPMRCDEGLDCCSWVQGLERTSVRDSFMCT